MKKGFTLIEMLVTIVVIAVLVTIGIAVYNGLSTRSKQRLYETKVNLVETNAEKWAEDMNLTEPMSINIERLVTEGYHEADKEKPGEEYELQVIDPRDNRVMNCDIINISFENGNIIAKHIEIEDCSTVADANVTDGAKIAVTAEEKPLNTNDKTYYTDIDKKGGINGILSWTRHNVTLTLDVDNTEYSGEVNWYQNGNKITNNENPNSIDIRPELLLQSVYTVTISDKTGVKKKNITVKIDKEAPTDADIKMDDFGKWLNREVKTTMKSSDLGSGIKNYEYSIDQINWIPIETGKTNNNLNVTSMTDTTKNKRTVNAVFDIAKQTTLKKDYYIRVTDNVDNVTSNKKVTVMIDRYIPPTPTLTNTSNGSWVRTSIGVTASSLEQGSGIKEYQYSEDGINWITYATNTSKNIYSFNYSVTDKTKIAVTYDTASFTSVNKTIRIRLIDNAGNISAVASTSVKIDKVAPVLTINPTYLSIFLGTNYSLLTGVSYSDAHSGVASFTTSATNANAFAVGNHTITYTVVDNVGNTTTGTRTLNIYHTETRYRTRSVSDPTPCESCGSRECPGNYCYGGTCPPGHFPSRNSGCSAGYVPVNNFCCHWTYKCPGGGSVSEGAKCYGSWSGWYTGNCSGKSNCETRTCVASLPQGQC